MQNSSCWNAVGTVSAGCVVRALRAGIRLLLVPVVACVAAGCASLALRPIAAPATTRPAEPVLYPAIVPWKVVTNDSCGEGKQASDFPCWGYIDRNGVFVVPPVLEHAEEFREGVAVVRIDLATVAVGPDGRLVRRISEGFRQWQEGKRSMYPMDWRECLIDTTGRVIAGPLERDASISSGTSCGVAVVHEGSVFDHEGFINTDGKWLIRPGIPEAHPFSEGLARVRLSGAKGGRVPDLFLGPVQFIDQRGALAFDGAFDDAGDFKEGLAPVKVGSKYGFIDKSGKLVIAPQWLYAAEFSEGLAAVEGENGKMGFLDRTGAVVIAPQFKFAFRFSEGLASASAEKGEGFIDRSGKWVVPPQYDYVGDFSNGLVVVARANKYGYVDKSGNVVVPLIYDRAEKMAEGMGRVRTQEGEGFVDETGKVVIAPQFSFARDFHNGLALVSWKPEQNGYINKQGKVVWKSPRFRQGWFRAEEKEQE